jgi:hypothetical protein
MRTTIIGVVVLGFVFPFLVEAKSAGVWTTPKKPGYLFQVTEGDVNSEPTFSLTVLRPNGTWNVFFGPNALNEQTGEQIVDLVPLLGNSDMRATWFAEGTVVAGEPENPRRVLMIESCTQDCLVSPGEWLVLKKFYGEGINILNGQPVSYSCGYQGLSTHLYYAIVEDLETGLTPEEADVLIGCVGQQKPDGNIRTYTDEIFGTTIIVRFAFGHSIDSSVETFEVIMPPRALIFRQN